METITEITTYSILYNKILSYALINKGRDVTYDGILLNSVFKSTTTTTCHDSLVVVNTYVTDKLYYLYLLSGDDVQKEDFFNKFKDQLPEHKFHLSPTREKYYSLLTYEELINDKKLFFSFIEKAIK